jgi:hypothetical protein
MGKKEASPWVEGDMDRSHGTHSYVGNTMATFVMQALGCEVSAINTVQFSASPPRPCPAHLSNTA